MSLKFIVTGGAGFIGSALVRHIINETEYSVLNVDKLTYAGNLESLSSVAESERYSFSQTDICDSDAIEKICSDYKPDAVFHLAAESHVDRSIDGPGEFVQTNVMGTYNLLECARRYWSGLEPAKKKSFRFIHVSTDEVYGSLGTEGYFEETTPYDPSSPYSASKAGSDHLAKAWGRTFKLPVIVTNCSNNYGPYQFPEKLVPVIVLKALKREPIPVYGKGENIRDWLFVDDHVRALLTVREKGRLDETYNVGGNSERRNIEVVHTVCQLLDELLPDKPEGGHASLIKYVTDRPGHDMRYAIDATKLKNELDWVPEETFESGMRKTIEWYLANQEWWERILSGDYQLERLGQASV